MKTEELVTLLATGLEPVDSRRALRRFPVAWIVGLPAALLVTVGWLGFNPALLAELRLPMFWVKASFCASLAMATFIAVRRLARPGSRLGRVPMAMAVPVLAMWLLAVVVLVDVPPQERAALMLGHTALVCPWRITVLSAPLFVTLIWALRGTAPTQLRLAGAAAGFAAGSGGALCYTLHCPELAAPFLAIWYLIGMLIPAAVGAFLGSYVLRW